jgi:uncharacterized protein with GYD domain
VAGSGWDTATRIESDDTDNAEGADVALDSSGNAIAVWHQSDSTRFDIWANRYEPATGWGTPEKLDSEDLGDALYPKVAMDSGGNAIVVWQQSDASRENIWSNRYSSATGWGTAELIETDNAGRAAAPKVAFDGSGNAVAVWHQWDGTRDNVWANRYPAGGSWGAAVEIEADDTAEATGPRVALDASGNAIAVWQQADNILANRYDVTGGAWGAAAAIESEAGVADSPRVAVDGSGNALAVWSQFDTGSSSYNLWANRYEAGSGWGTAELIESNGGSVNSLSGVPDVAADEHGNALVVWIHQNSGVLSVWANRYVAGTGWGTEELLESVDTGDAKLPAIAIDDSGRAMAVWYQDDATRYNVHANRFE